MSYGNDTFAAATVLTGSSGSITPFHYDGVGDPAGSEAGESVYGAGETLWWRWTAPFSGAASFTTSGSPSDDLAPEGLDTTLQVFTGGGFASPVVTNDDGTGVAYDYNSRADFTATSGVTYWIQLDQLDPAQAGTVHLSWDLVAAAPTATSWTQATGRNYHTAIDGDDLTVVGTGFGDLTGVTIGGVSQSFTATDSTHLVVHVGPSALTGPLIVTGPGGSGTAPGDVTMLYYGPWVQPPDATAVNTPGFPGATTYTTGTVNGSTQPDLAGATRHTPDGSAFFAVYVLAHLVPTDLTSFHPDGTWDWDMWGAVVALDNRASTYPDTMPPVDAYAIAIAAGAVDFESEGDRGVPVGNVTITFDTRLDNGVHIEDTDNRTTAEDLWQQTVEFRRLEPGDWDFGAPFGYTPEVSAWPSAGTLAARTLDAAQPVLRHGDEYLYLTDSPALYGSYVNNSAQAIQPTGGAPMFGDPDVISFADFGDGRAWAVAFSSAIDGSPITPPVIGDPFATYGGAHEKSLSGEALVRATWPYRPPRYRLLFTTPQVTTRPPLRQRQRGDALAGGAPRQVGVPSAAVRQGPGAVR